MVPGRRENIYIQTLFILQEKKSWSVLVEAWFRLHKIVDGITTIMRVILCQYIFMILFKEKNISNVLNYLAIIQQK
jgi:hypothetical protein